MKHVHEWVYLGDMALVVGSKEKDVNLRRLEYCVGCSTLRVEFPSGWYDMRGSATDLFLDQFQGEEPGNVFKIQPIDFKPIPPGAKPSRLGTTLKELALRSIAPKSPFQK